jgi:AcrR family transcriptional regulator
LKRTEPGPRPEDLAEDKRRRIIDAAIAEFAERGYELASTNAITARAGVSKGLLFHYFGSKKDLYLYLVDHLVDRYTERFFEDLPELDPDVIERIFQIALHRHRVLLDEPQVNKFLIRAFKETPEEVRHELTSLEDELQERSNRILTDGVDTSRFRRGVDPRKAVTLVTVCLEGLRELFKERLTPDLAERPEEAARMLEEVREYLDILKYGLYEREEGPRRP